MCYSYRENSDSKVYFWTRRLNKSIVFLLGSLFFSLIVGSMQAFCFDLRFYHLQRLDELGFLE